MNHWDTSYKNSLMNESRLIIKINAVMYSYFIYFYMDSIYSQMLGIVL